MALHIASTKPEVPDHLFATHYRDEEDHDDVLGTEENSPINVAEEDTVWIGFMDIVPVIGTVKEAVELVLALYEGNEAVIKQKEKAIENIVKMWTLADEVAAAAAKIPLKEKVIEIRKGMITECSKDPSKQGTKPPTAAEQTARQEKVEAIKRDMLEKIHIINPKFRGDLKEQLERSFRGEHVFNNGILKFNLNSLKEFTEKHYISELRDNEQKMKELGKHPLSPNTEKEIQTNMVVHFDKYEFYVNANGVIYGEYCRALRGTLLDVLRHRKTDDEKSTNEMKKVIDNMNKCKAYVDDMAANKWINETQNKKAKNNKNNEQRFKDVRQEVEANMFNTDRMLDWCRRVLDEVAPYFKPRQ
ncbi:hypothetical protein QQF64_024110 [Cirrhinus molitorella]|uniref:Uncharacterized protein n=1 Tax=Cirrhinus molitorella TaxID=172907 RepID=A0ABR3NKZ2_9TELE